MDTLYDVVLRSLGQRFSRTLSERCESPIEVILGTAIYMADRRNIIVAAQEDDYGQEKCLLLIPQFQFDHYRFDFAVTDWKKNQIYLFVECDGHDFHERTKEQAAHDREKDRYAQINGVPIFRYTGSEIYHRSDACSRQILDFVQRSAT